MEKIVIDDLIIKEAENAILEYSNHTEMVIDLETVGTLKKVSTELSKLSKELDKKRQEYVRPALDEQKRINEIFKDPIGKLDELSRKIINRVNDFIKAEQKKEADRLALIAKENAAKLLSGQEIQKEVVKAPELPKITETKYWDYEVIDFDKIPKELLALDHTKVTELIRAGKRQIPGLHILQKTRTVRR